MEDFKIIKPEPKEGKKITFSDFFKVLEPKIDLPRQGRIKKLVKDRIKDTLKGIQCHNHDADSAFHLFEDRALDYALKWYPDRGETIYYIATEVQLAVKAMFVFFFIKEGGKMLDAKIRLKNYEGQLGYPDVCYEYMTIHIKGFDCLRRAKRICKKLYKNKHHKHTNSMAWAVEKEFQRVFGNPIKDEVSLMRTILRGV